jgi:hypothetical protein
MERGDDVPALVDGAVDAVIDDGAATPLPTVAVPDVLACCSLSLRSRRVGRAIASFL